MKLFFLIIFLCGITTTPTHTVAGAKAKKACACHSKATAKSTTVNMDMVPSGLLFQF